MWIITKQLLLIIQSTIFHQPPTFNILPDNTKSMKTPLPLPGTGQPESYMSGIQYLAQVDLSPTRVEYNTWYRWMWSGVHHWGSPNEAPLHTGLNLLSSRMRQGPGGDHKGRSHGGMFCGPLLLRDFVFSISIRACYPGLSHLFLSRWDTGVSHRAVWCTDKPKGCASQ